MCGALAEAQGAGGLVLPHKAGFPPGEKFQEGPRGQPMAPEPSPQHWREAQEGMGSPGMEDEAKGRGPAHV